MNIVPFLFLLAPLLVIPLGLPLFPKVNAPPFPAEIATYLKKIRLLAASLLLLSFFFAPGTQAMILALPWVLFTFLLAGWGAARLWQERFSFPSLAFNMSLLYISIGGVWLFFARWGQPLLGFSGIWVLLTAVHFHFTGFAATLITGLIGTRVKGKLYNRAATAVLFSPLLVAVGITYSPTLETIGALILAISLSIINWLSWKEIIPHISDRLTRTLFRISAISIWIGMFFASAYALRTIGYSNWFTLPHMAQFHGSSNAIGFVTCGLWGWYRLRLSHKEMNNRD